jgi:putative nucleotidyltransferase with HDIG domain
MLLGATPQPQWAKIHTTDWWKALANCMQAPDYHAEGDVATHTEMVVTALHGLAEYADLSGYEQQILTVAALLHDIAKPICTITEDRRISSPRHAKVGEKMTRELLWDADFTTREHIASLVRLHGLPLWILEKPNPYAAVISASLRTPNKWTYLLAKADVLGRICADKAQLLERVEFFRAFCIEQNCFEKPFAFANEHSKFRYFLAKSEFPADLYDDTQFQIEFLSGIAGSGKDTYLRSNTRPVISLDDLRRDLKVKHGDAHGQGIVIQKAYEMAKKYAAAKQSFIWNSTNLTTDMRSKLVHILSVYNPRFRITYIETSWQNIFARRSSDIPAAALAKMIQILDMPMQTEAHEIVYLRNS